MTDSLQRDFLGLPSSANFIAPAFALSFTFMLLFSPHYPWYVAWLVPFLALIPNLTAFTYICGLFYLCTTELAVGTGPLQFLLNKILYGGVLVALLVELLLRRWPFHQYLIGTAPSDEESARKLARQRIL